MFSQDMMCSPRLSLGQFNIRWEWAVDWNTDVVALSVGPSGETTTSQQSSGKKIVHVVTIIHHTKRFDKKGAT